MNLWRTWRHTSKQMAHLLRHLSLSDVTQSRPTQRAFD